MKLPTTADEFVSFMTWVWSHETSYPQNAREIAALIDAERLYHTVGGRASVWELLDKTRVIISNDGLEIRKPRHHRVSKYHPLSRFDNQLKYKGGHYKVLRKTLQVLVALLDAQAPADELLERCDDAYVAIRYFKQVETEAGAGLRKKRARRHLIKRANEMVQQPHYMKFLRECKRLGINPVTEEYDEEAHNHEGPEKGG
jgi:hypothetical protein